uniref:Putative secreted protein n=1 Tax=Ixodes ricinus TaxID=34613 RepID=A0A6B0UFF1_IXORI
MWRSTSFLVMMPRILPLCVTSVCRRPNLRNMSITVSMGVWSVTVMGARSRMRLSVTGGGPVQGVATWLTNRARELPTTPTWDLRALARARLRSLRSTKPTRY